MAIDEACDLARSGVRVSFLGAVAPVSDQLRTNGIRVVCLNQQELASAASDPKVAIAGLWNGSAYRAMRRLLEDCDRRGTIVHVHGFTQALGASAIRCAVESGVGVVCTLHDYFTVCPNGGLFNYGARRQCELHPLSAQCIFTDCDKRNYIHKVYRVARTVIQQKYGLLPKGIKHYISLSDTSEAVLRKYLPHDSKFFRLQNPINVPRRPPAAVAESNRLIVVGRLDPEKGIDVAVRAAEISSHPITFVGGGPGEREARMSPFCDVTGWLPRERVVSEIAAARCLLFPSLWKETYGLCVDEAAALGIPSIVSACTAAAERVEDGVTGWHAPPGDVDAWAECITRMADDLTVARMGRAAYERFWETREDEATRTEKLKHIYEEVLSRL